MITKSLHGCCVLPQSIEENTACEHAWIRRIDPGDVLDLAQAPLIDGARNVHRRQPDGVLPIRVREEKGVERSIFVEREPKRLGHETRHLVPSTLEEDRAQNVIHGERAATHPTILLDEIDEGTCQPDELIRFLAGVLPAPQLGDEDLPLVRPEPEQLLVAQGSGTERRLDELASLAHERR